jgi:hypothetical protein
MIVIADIDKILDKKPDSMDMVSIKVKSFMCSTSFRSLDRFHLHAKPEGADGERTPTLYLGLKNYYGAKSSPKTVGRFGLTQFFEVVHRVTF